METKKKTVRKRRGKEIPCQHCGTKVYRCLSEIERRKNMKTFCNHACRAAHKVASKPPNERFTVYISRARRGRCTECTIDTYYLQDLWNAQNGICPITGWKLILQGYYSERDGITIYHASLDRIDPSKGYIEGNVRFVSVMANYAKYKWDDDDLIKFCKAVANNN